VPSRGGTAGNRTNPTPLCLQPLFIRSAYSRSASIDSRMNLSCFDPFRTAEPKKKVHDASSLASSARSGAFTVIATSSAPHEEENEIARR